MGLVDRAHEVCLHERDGATSRSSSPSSELACVGERLRSRERVPMKDPVPMMRDVSMTTQDRRADSEVELPAPLPATLVFRLRGEEVELDATGSGRRRTRWCRAVGVRARAPWRWPPPAGASWCSTWRARRSGRRPAWPPGRRHPAEQPDRARRHRRLRHLRPVLIPRPLLITLRRRRTARSTTRRASAGDLAGVGRAARSGRAERRRQAGPATSTGPRAGRRARRDEEEAVANRFEEARPARPGTSSMAPALNSPARASALAVARTPWSSWRSWAQNSMSARPPRPSLRWNRGRRPAASAPARRAPSPAGWRPVRRR